MDSQDKSMAMLDDEVARLTDAVLRGDSASASEEAAPLLEVARQLDHLIAPREALSDVTQARLRQSIDAAWAQRGAAKPPRVASRSWLVGWAAAAAALVLVVLLIPPQASFPLNLSGAAAEAGAAAAEISWRALVFVLGSAGLVLYLLYRLRR
jgi:hypothetical protein